jgi:hypothetical protein
MISPVGAFAILDTLYFTINITDMKLLIITQVIDTEHPILGLLSEMRVKIKDLFHGNYTVKKKVKHSVS